MCVCVCGGGGGGGGGEALHVIDSISIWYDLGNTMYSLLLFKLHTHTCIYTHKAKQKKNSEWWYGHGRTSRSSVQISTSVLENMPAKIYGVQIIGC